MTPRGANQATYSQRTLALKRAREFARMGDRVDMLVWLERAQALGPVNELQIQRLEKLLSNAGKRRWK